MKPLYETILITLYMAKFKITPTTTVAELKEQFSNEVGGVLRIYEGRSEAADGAILVSLGAKEGELECRTSRTVGKFEEAFQNDLNLKVRVYTKDNWVKVLDGITLATVAELPNGMTKAKMEEYLSYKRDEKEEDTASETSVEEIDVRDGYDASVALAQETASAAAAFHKLGDGYDDEDEVKENMPGYFVLLEKDGEYTAYAYPEWDDIEDGAENADAVYYRDMDDNYTSDETEDIIMDNSQWGCEDYSLDNAIEDVLSGGNEYEWPTIDVDFIYNGKVFYSFTL